MTSNSRTRLIGVLGATAMAALSPWSTLLPSKWVPRTGLGWQDEHFVVYFATTIVLSLASRRPYVVAVALMMFAGFLEACQGLTTDRFPDFRAALSRGGRRDFRCDVGLTCYPREKVIHLMRRCYPSASSGMASASRAHPQRAKTDSLKGGVGAT